MPVSLRALVALLLVSGLAACDTAQPAPEVSLDAADLVGTWAVADFTYEIEVVSTVDQAVALTDEAGEGGLVVTGDGTTTFRYLAGTGTDSLEQSRTFIVSEAGPTPTYPAHDTRVELFTGADGRSFVTLYTDDDRYRVVTDADDPAFTVQAGGLSVSERTLASASGETRILSGTLAFPIRSLDAGVPTALPPGSARGGRTPYITGITFAADGTFTADAGPGIEPQALQGTWTSPAPGRVTATYVSDLGSNAVDYTFAVEDGALALEKALGPFERGQGSAPSLAGTAALSYLVEPTSFTSIRSVESYRLTGGTD